MNIWTTPTKLSALVEMDQHEVDSLVVLMRYYSQYQRVSGKLGEGEDIDIHSLFTRLSTVFASDSVLRSMLDMILYPSQIMFANKRDERFNIIQLATVGSDEFIDKVIEKLKTFKKKGKKK